MNSRLVFGFCNVAFFATRPEGTETWFSTQSERNRALTAVRERATGAGLSESAARAGIYPITSTLAAVRGRIGPAVRVSDDLAALVF